MCRLHVSLAYVYTHAINPPVVHSHMLHKGCPHVARMWHITACRIPACCPHDVARMLPACCPHVAHYRMPHSRMLPTCCPHVARMWHIARMWRITRNPKSTITIAHTSLSFSDSAQHCQWGRRAVARAPRNMCPYHKPRPEHQCRQMHIQRHIQARL
jgi:hypothetical protein